MGTPRAFRTGARGTKGIEATGRQRREHAPGDTPAGADAFETSLTALGWRPTVEVGREPTGQRFRLGNCPYQDVVKENQTVSSERCARASHHQECWISSPRRQDHRVRRPE